MQDARHSKFRCKIKIKIKTKRTEKKNNTNNPLHADPFTHRVTFKCVKFTNL